MAGYTKLFARILDSTVWREPDPIRILWITMLALADRDGVVHCTVPGLADRARISIEQCRAGISRFTDTDPDSLTTSDEGRRIRRVEDGWELINYQKYRSMMSEEEQREKSKIRMANWRKRKKLEESSVTVTPCNASYDIAEAEAEAEAYIKPFSLLAEVSGNGNSRKSKSKADPRHIEFKDLIFRCYNYLNGENPPWDASDAKQLSNLLKAKPDLDAKRFHLWLGNYAESKDINPADRPRRFLQKLPSYANGSLNQYGRPDG